VIIASFQFYSRILCCHRGGCEDFSLLVHKALSSAACQMRFRQCRRITRARRQHEAVSKQNYLQILLPTTCEIFAYCRACSMLGGSLSPQHGASSGCGWRNGLQLYCLGSRDRTTRGGPPASGLGVGLTTRHRKKEISYEKLNRASNLDGYLNKRPKRQNMDMRIGYGM
jgi:hypothetical protein